MALTLHFHPLSSYCHKVLVALYELDVKFDGKLLDLGDPAARAAFYALWPTGKMPLLIHDGRVVPETTIQIEYLDRLHPRPLPLLPRDPQAALDARLWDRLVDLYVMTPMQTLVSNQMRPESDRDPIAVKNAHATLASSYELIEQHMNGRDWLAGDTFSMADCAAAPSLFYAMTHLPFAPTQPNLAAYFERLVTRPSVARVLAEARPYFHLYPLRHAIPARFLDAP